MSQSLCLAFNLDVSGSFRVHALKKKVNDAHTDRANLAGGVASHIVSEANAVGWLWLGFDAAANQVVFLQ